MNKQTIKVLKEINDSVPKAWWSQLTKKIWANPTIRLLVDKGLEDPEVNQETKDKLETLKRSEEYSQTVDVVDEEIEKKIDEHLTRKVRQATKSGRLPPLTKKDFANVRKLKKEGVEKQIATG